MTEADKENIKEEIINLQSKLDNLVNKLEIDAEESASETQQQDQDVVQNKNIPVVLIDTTTEQKE